MDTNTAVINLVKGQERRLSGIEKLVTGIMQAIQRLGGTSKKEVIQAKIHNTEQPDEDHGEEEQAWMEDAADKATRTEQFPTTPAITIIDVIERTINMGNTVKERPGSHLRQNG